jgi:hypothetical protein
MMTRVLSTVCALAVLSLAAAQTLIFEDEFNEIDFDVWQHERTMSGGGVSGGGGGGVISVTN